MAKKTAKKSKRTKLKPNDTWMDRTNARPKETDTGSLTYEMPIKMGSLSDGKNKIGVGMTCEFADINETNVRKMLVGANVEMHLTDPREVRGQEILPNSGGEKNEITLKGEISGVMMKPDSYSFGIKMSLDAVDLNELRKFKFRKSNAFITRIGDASQHDESDENSDTPELAMAGDNPE